MKCENMADDATLFDFPCRFPVKAMGHDAEGFPAHVMELVGAVVGEIDHEDVEIRSSRQGHYISVTIVITAQSREQLDAIYTNLTSSERVLVAL